jgi:hypothetical protein
VPIPKNTIFYRIFRSMIGGELITHPANEADMEDFPTIACTTFATKGWLIYEDRSPANLQTLAEAWHCHLACDNAKAM